MLILHGLQKLKRDSRKVFLGVFTLDLITKWELKSLDGILMDNEFIVICYSEVNDQEFNTVVFMDPKLMTSLPAGDRDHQFPVLFVKETDYFPLYIENQLYKLEEFERLIEKGPRLSANSTKLMTMYSLRDIMVRVFTPSVPRSHWNKISSDMIEYVKGLLENYPDLAYLPVSARRQFRKQNVSDQSFAWELYFRYYYDNWLSDHQIKMIPDLSKRYRIKNWEGNFFDRSNPIWSEFVGDKNKFIFNSSQRELIYSIWRKWLKEPE